VSAAVMETVGIGGAMTVMVILEGTQASEFGVPSGFVVPAVTIKVPVDAAGDPAPKR